MPEPGQRIETLRPASLPVPVPSGIDGKSLHRYGTKVGPRIFTAGLTATDYTEDLAGAARINKAFPYYGEAGRLQTDYILKNLQLILAEGGASMAEVVKAEVFLTDIRDFYGLEQVWKGMICAKYAKSVIGLDLAPTYRLRTAGDRVSML
jgi:enamine deaminase RidA (YjgF/YER057c/UK114 family)